MRTGGSTKVFLCGDVVLARGIDMICKHSPQLHESYVKDSRVYVEIAERMNSIKVEFAQKFPFKMRTLAGTDLLHLLQIPRNVEPAYVWGSGLAVLDHEDPDLRFINLETAVTTSDDWDRDKGIHYRMHPANIDILQAAQIDGCVLANNHALDWGPTGFAETLESVKSAGIWPVASLDSPCVADNTALLAVAGPDCGAPASWSRHITLLRNYSSESVARVVKAAKALKKDGKVVLLSIHWGGNWGYELNSEHQRFARALLDSGFVDLVWGHSSHHPKGMEKYRDRLIIYGAGDLLTDYEGIDNHREFHSELALMYFPTLSQDGALEALHLVPMRVKGFRLHHTSQEEAHFLAQLVRTLSIGFASEFKLEKHKDLHFRIIM